MSYSRRLLLIITLINLFVALLAAVSAFQGYQQYQERARITTHNLVAALESHLADAIRRADISLLSLIDLYEHKHMDAEHLNHHIELLRSRLPEVEAIRITDRDGNLILGTGVVPAKRINLADRPHFIRLRDDSGDELQLSKPQISRVNNKWVIVMARRTTRADGRFNGMIFATVTLEYFTHLFSRLDLGFNGVAFLRDADMGLIARYPIINTPEIQVGKPFATPELAALLAAGKTQGSYFSGASPDQIERMISFRKLEHYPLLAFIGMAADDYLAPWRSDTQRLVILILLFIAGSAYAYRIQHRAWRRQQADVAIKSARLRLMEDTAHHSVHEQLVATLDEACALSESPIGFYHFLAPDQKTLALQAWSTRTLQEYCHAKGEGRHYNIDEAGVWVEAIRERRPIIHNDYAALTNKRGLPPGHAVVLREMVIPVFRKGLIVAILGVGNKATLYTEYDLQTVSLLADLAWDIVESKRLEAELVEMATTDFLTSLLNRRNFLSTMEHELDRLKRFDIPRAAVLMLDLDHFKCVNDTYGHAAGDAVLKHFAGLIRAELRKVDSGGRLGGEEFAILLLGAQLDAAHAFAERLRKTVEVTPLLFENQPIAITVSIGIAMLSPDDAGPDHALMRADKALYEAKHSGRNRVCCAPSPEENPHGHSQATDPATH
ncbi:MAG: diguanylate cyclase [Rhodocyclaceae bacterium]|nr:diguanylate cyclase [Rhodocyclaceae bacterium]MDZ4214861.1 diguanylate cyclase [Rhodocyclaceae bacterium]